MEGVTAHVFLPQLRGPGHPQVPWRPSCRGTGCGAVLGPARAVVIKSRQTYVFPHPAPRSSAQSLREPSPVLPTQACFSLPFFLQGLPGPKGEKVSDAGSCLDADMMKDARNLPPNPSSGVWPWAGHIPSWNLSFPIWKVGLRMPPS